LDVKIKTALISVSDKSGLEKIVHSLKDHGVKVVSTGGTAKAIAEMGVDVMDVSTLTNFPEMMDGRVKTLHPNVHGGLLAKRDDKDHVQSQTEHGIEDIDLIIVNLYPFEETINTQENEEICIENIDIGGPAMLRSAAKNHKFVTVVTDASDYDKLIDEMKQNNGSTTFEFRKQLAAKTFSTTAYYDSLISNWFHRNSDKEVEKFSTAGKLSSKLRYGENPHQSASLYKSSMQQSGIPHAKLLQGKELSYNNINDADAALQLIKEFDEDTPSVAIIKHANPCGVASGGSLREAYMKALSCDTTSAFGGIIALNQTIDKETASEIIKIFTEVIIAPDVNNEAKEVFKSKNNLRVLILSSVHKNNNSQNFKSIEGGILVQSNDEANTTKSGLNVVTEKKPSQNEIEDMLFAFKVCKHVKSNAIIYVKNKKTIGIGAGQMSRVDSAKIASQKNSEMEKSDENSLENSVVASDAFFPFADGLLVTVSYGAKAVIQPGGSMKDDEVIAAANEAGISMVFTGKRHFRH
jgi:phosphoribosylaminoimidazolecarboxamide formyltransferase/IMP cyclohydrolase